MILSLSRNNDCIISISYINTLLNICNIQASKIVIYLKKKVTPIAKNINTQNMPLPYLLTQLLKI